jgi:hypothetical protein
MNEYGLESCILLAVDDSWITGRTHQKDEPLFSISDPEYPYAAGLNSNRKIINLRF